MTTEEILEEIRAKAAALEMSLAESDKEEDDNDIFEGRDVQVLVSSRRRTQLRVTNPDPKSAETTPDVSRNNSEKSSTSLTNIVNSSCVEIQYYGLCSIYILQSPTVLSNGSSIVRSAGDISASVAGCNVSEGTSAAVSSCRGNAAGSETIGSAGIAGLGLDIFLSGITLFFFSYAASSGSPFKYAFIWYPLPII